MFKHHEESIKNMISHYQKNAEIIALFLIGSVATGTARADSDLDGVAVVSENYLEWRRKNGGLEEVCREGCTYEGGYFNIHYMTIKNLENTAANGQEPMRNMFVAAQPLFCPDPAIQSLVAKIPIFQTADAAAKQFKFYCTFRMFYNYFWVSCKPTGYMRHHVIDGMIYNLYRLILLENQILFPSMRKLEEYVKAAPNKPANILEKCAALMSTQSNEDCTALVAAYETWTSYDFPKDHNVIMNNFNNPLEWQ
ncbi:MAG: nucleotidyltransferase domain-containing protein [Defluviitaleaceae bacterium]|nr:nucleotidyltransferase domain-containing protein [Defluviitaleaceae bacterium]